MPQYNLTREEARRRSSLVDVSSYENTLILTGVGESFRVRSRIRFTATPESTTFIDAITASVERIRLNGLDLETSEVLSPHASLCLALPQRTNSPSMRTSPT